MESPVEIFFDCLPLRSIGRLDVPLDASPEYRALCLQIKAALARHGAYNSYFLRSGRCVFHLTNDPTVGVVSYRFHGVVVTDETDARTKLADLSVEFEAEACDWLTRDVAEWFEQTVSKAVAVEFDRYIAAGDLAKAVERLEKIQQQSEQQQGYLGMYL